MTEVDLQVGMYKRQPSPSKRVHSKTIQNEDHEFVNYKFDCGAPDCARYGHIFFL